MEYDKGIIIVGGRNSGKTALAKGLCAHVYPECVAFLDGKTTMKRTFPYSVVNKKTEYLILDDCKVEDIEDMFSGIIEGIQVEKINEEPFMVHPKIILVMKSDITISDLKISSSFNRRWMIMETKKYNF